MQTIDKKSIKIYNDRGYNNVYLLKITTSNVFCVLR
jgi:hypothetical protein